MTKKQLLENISEEKIYSRYLEIPLKDIQTEHLFRNPLRIDYNVTCKFYYANHDGRLRFTDFDGFTSRVINGKSFKSWDCFDTVQHIINLSGGLNIPIGNNTLTLPCDINSSKLIKIGSKNMSIRKISFAMLIKIIAQEFNLEDNNIDIDISTTIKKQQVRSKRVVLEYDITHRAWVNIDKDYWGKYHIRFTKNQMIKFKHFKIYPVLEIISKATNTVVYNFSPNDICYVYYITKTNNIDIVQFYYPMRDRSRPKFIINNIHNNIMFGLEQLMPGKLGIITKANKDAILLRSFKVNDTYIRTLGALSETQLMPDDLWNNIRHYCDYWITLFDYDYTGIRLSILYYKIYRINPILFFKYKALPFKDIKRLYNEFGISLVNTILTRKIPDKYHKLLSFFNKKDFSDNLEVLGNINIQNIINKWNMELL